MEIGKETRRSYSENNWNCSGKIFAAVIYTHKSRRGENGDGWGLGAGPLADRLEWKNRAEGSRTNSC